MKIIYFAIISICCFTACSNSRYKFWPLSKFNITDSALKNKEPVKLFYSSREPGESEQRDYFVHLIVISQVTNDTVNILTTFNNGFSIADSATVFNYFDKSSLETTLTGIDPEKLNDVKELDRLSAPDYKTLTRVVRDPHFDYIADNHYPTVIGTIGTVTK